MMSPSSWESLVIYIRPTAPPTTYLLDHTSSQLLLILPRYRQETEPAHHRPWAGWSSSLSYLNNDLPDAALYTTP